MVKRVLKNAKADTRNIINQYLMYGEDSAGSIMTSEFIHLRKNMTVDSAFEKVRENARDMETIYTCYVTDDSRRLEGGHGRHAPATPTTRPPIPCGRGTADRPAFLTPTSRATAWPMCGHNQASGIKTFPGLGISKGTAEDFDALMNFVLTGLNRPDAAAVVAEMQRVDGRQQWGVWGAGPAMSPGSKNGWSQEEGGWVVNTVGFAGPPTALHAGGHERSRRRGRL